VQKDTHLYKQIFVTNTFCFRREVCPEINASRDAFFQVSEIEPVVLLLKKKDKKTFDFFPNEFYTESTIILNLSAFKISTEALPVIKTACRKMQFWGIKKIHTRLWYFLIDGLTINVPVLHMARDIMILMQANPFRGPRNGRVQKSLDFQGLPLPIALETKGGTKCIYFVPLAVQNVSTSFRYPPPPP
jgi:hypothetical protein